MGKTIHGMKKTRIYKSWERIKRRCNNPKTYKNYGGRGIKVCDEWSKDFMAFYEWAMANGYRDDLTIDRIDVNGNYEPNNCRWVTMKEQENNRRNNHHITYNGETHTIAEWGDILNIPYKVLLQRITTYKWSIEKAFNIPVRPKKKTKSN